MRTLACHPTRQRAETQEDRGIAGRFTVLGQVSWVDQTVPQDRVAQAKGRVTEAQLVASPRATGSGHQKSNKAEPRRVNSQGCQIPAHRPNGGRATQRGNLLRAGPVSRKRGGPEWEGPVLANELRCLRVKLPGDPCWA